MQISKCLLAICLALVCVVPLSSYGADQTRKPSQAPSSAEDIEKARDAMRRALDQATGTVPAAPQAPAAPAAPQTPAPPAAPETPATPAAPVQPATPPSAPPVAVPTPPPANPPAAATATSSDAIEQARAAMRRKLDEVTGAPSTAPTAPPVATMPSPPPAPNRDTVPAPPPGRLQMEQPSAPPIVAGPQSDTDSIARARDALRAKMAELEKQQHMAGGSINTGGPAMAEPTKPPKPTTSGKPPEFPPLPAPPSPLSPDKQQRLADLLRRYRADQLTPEQYQAERAKIVGEPQ